MTGTLAQVGYAVPGPNLAEEMYNVDIVLKCAWEGNTHPRPYLTMYDIASHSLRTKHDGMRKA